MAVGGSIWKTLGIAPTNEVDDIRRAYARRLKQVHPEDDPEGFQALREACDQATRLASGRALRPDNPGPAQDVPFLKTDRVPLARDASFSLQTELEGLDQQSRDHDQLIRDLFQYTLDADHDADDLMDSLMNILRSPAMDSVIIYGETEMVLYHLVNSGRPNIGPLVDPLIAYFGWKPNDLNNARPLSFDALQQRDFDRQRDVHNRWFKSLASPKNPLHQVYLALKQPPTKLTVVCDRFVPGLHKKVADLLKRIRTTCPKNESQLNADVISLWEQRLSRPRLSEAFFWVMGLVPLATALLFALTQPPEVSAPGVFVGFWLLTAAPILLVRLAWIYLIDWPVWHRRRRNAPEESAEDLALRLRRASQTWSPDHGAYKALSLRPSLRSRVLDRLTPGLADRIKKILGNARRNEVPEFTRLDPDAVARWDRILSRPRVGQATFGAALVLSIAWLPVAVAAFLGGAETDFTGLAFWGLLLAAVILTRLFILYVVQWPVRLGLRFLRQRRTLVNQRITTQLTTAP